MKWSVLVLSQSFYRLLTCVDIKWPLTFIEAQTEMLHSLMPIYTMIMMFIRAFTFRALRAFDLYRPWGDSSSDATRSSIGENVRLTWPQVTCLQCLQCLQIFVMVKWCRFVIQRRSVIYMKSKEHVLGWKHLIYINMLRCTLRSWRTPSSKPKRSIPQFLTRILKVVNLQTVTAVANFPSILFVSDLDYVQATVLPRALL